MWRGFWVRLLQLRARAAVRAAKSKQASVETDTAAQLRAELARLKAATDAKLLAESKEADDDVPQWKRELREREAAKAARKHQRAVQVAAALRIQVSPPPPVCPHSLTQTRLPYYVIIGLLQKLIRGFIARRCMRVVRLLRGQQRGPIAITRLQAIVRGFIVRTRRAAARSKLHFDAALKIQLAMRRYLAKLRVSVRSELMRCLCFALLHCISSLRTRRRNVCNCKHLV